MSAKGRQFNGNRLAMAQRLAAAQKYQQQLQGSESSSSPFGWVSNIFGADQRSSGSQPHGSYGGGGSTTASCFTIDICPDLILAAIAAAGAAAAYLLYTAITAGRRRKRSGADTSLFLSFAERFLSLGRPSLSLVRK